MSSQGRTRAQHQYKCSKALASYVQLIEEGCELLGKTKEIPVPEHERNEIFSHRRQELWAHSRYTKARKELWDFLVDSKNNEFQ